MVEIVNAMRVIKKRIPVVASGDITEPILVVSLAQLVDLGITDELVADAFRQAVLPSGLWLVPLPDLVIP